VNCTWQLSNLQFSKCAPGYGWVLGGLRLGLFNDLQLDIDGTWQLSNLQFSKCAPGYGWVLGGLRLGLFNDLQLDIDVDGFANQHPPGF